MYIGAGRKEGGGEPTSWFYWFLEGYTLVGTDSCTLLLKSHPVKGRQKT